jgi:2-iminoacetate synthase ThiH
MQTIMNQVVGGSRGLSYCFFCSIRADKWEKDADWMTKDEVKSHSHYLVDVGLLRVCMKDLATFG